ncbi:F-actin-uncapping protein LRRC16A-like isoform X3 [Gigantopelta aegis]|uniref:F-actin-uncapping protein LRRC16A-like isoform X3 n=1 Tax=Gigantopelta aegis TaxID=1735272 RepID=UPI001B88E25D|nr:F-actin-uncapping protein LRRC16A-like isoform X3 [Gigantopelta aegis]
MAALNNIPRDILESFRDVFDRRIKINIKRMVRQEVRTDKLENKILAFSPCRLYVMAAKVPCRQEQSFHFLDIQALESRKPNRMVLTVDGKPYTFFAIDPDTDEIDYMITHIGKSLKHIFPAFPLERLIVKIDVVPPERLKTMYDMMRDIEVKEQGPCGGFTMMYACMCDYYGLTFRDEVAWDVDTIYLSQDTRELCLRDFDHLSGKDLVPIIAALEHNSWFTKLNASNVKLTPEASNEILKVMKRNAVIEELLLSNTGIKLDFIQKLSTALLSNSGTQLTSIDLSNNMLEDRVVIHMMGSISNLSKGLVSLDLSKTGLTSKGLNRIAETIAGSENIPLTLSTLILADNGQKGEELTSIYNFLAQSNVVSHLNLSSTDCSLDMLSAALVRGCTCNLVHLKLSHTVFTHRKTKDVQVPRTWKQFFASTYSLQYIDLSWCRLPPEAVKELLMGIASNNHMKSIEIDLSSNDLQTQGASIIGGCLPDIRNISSLDVSNNGFDQDLKHLLRDIPTNTHLKHLAIGQNFQGVKPKYIAVVLDPVIQMIQDEDCVLTSLSLADSKLKADTAFVINALGGNTKLEHLDLSGNLMGDLGARMLGKALQINTKLRSVLWDRNGTTAQGFEDIAEALEKNFTIRKMPFPVNDAAAAMKVNPERTELALQKIESLLQRNHSPCKIASDQAYRLQQGFLISSTQQMVDRLVVQVQDTVNALSIGPTENFKDSIEQANLVIKDADNSKQLLPRLQDIAIKSQNSGNATEVKLQEMADNLRQVMEKQIKKTVSEMLQCTKSQCSAVMSNEEFQTELNDGCLERSSLPRDFTKIVLDGVGTDVFNKLGELNLAVAAHISDQVVDEVIDSLTSSHKTLTNHLNLRKSGHYRESEVPEITEKADTETEKGSDDSKNLSPSYKGLSNLHASPKLQSKRKSLIGRKRRPQSVIGEGNAHGNHVDLKLDKVDEGKEKDVIENLDVVEMPQVPKLEHLSKARPKRAKRVAATRPVANMVAVDEAEDDGLNVFFVPSAIDSPATKRKEETTLVHGTKPEKQDTKPEVKKRGWFGKETKDKSVAKESKEKDTKKDKPTGIGAGFSNFFGRKSGAGKTAEVTKEKKQEPEPEKFEEESPSKTDSLKAREAKSVDVKKKENKPEILVDKESVSDKSDEENDEGPRCENGNESVREKDESVEAVPKMMPKVPRIGLGGNVMAEMKLKQGKRLSPRNPTEAKISPSVTPEKERVEANNNVIEKPAEDKDKSALNKVLSPPQQVGTVSSHPTPVPRSAIMPKRPTVTAAAAAAASPTNTGDSLLTSASSAQANTSSAQTSVDSSQANTSSVQANTSSLKANTGSVKANTSSAQANTSSAQANTDSIKANTGSVKADTGSVKADTGSVQANTGSLKANTGSLKANTSSVKADTSSVTANTSSVKVSTSSLKASANGSVQLGDDSSVQSNVSSPKATAGSAKTTSASSVIASPSPTNISPVSKEQKPESKQTPPPILKSKPKPPVLKPKPRSQRMSREILAPDDTGLASGDKQKDLSADKKSDGEIVYDSATLRLTVKEKIQRLSKTFKDDDDAPATSSPLLKPKTATLTRNTEETEASDDSLQESKSESVSSVTDDAEKTEEDKSVKSQSKSSGESTPDSVDSRSSSDIEEHNGKASPVLGVDEIMV